jgi:hypothetical protein
MFDEEELEWWTWKAVHDKDARSVWMEKLGVRFRNEREYMNWLSGSNGGVSNERSLMLWLKLWLKMEFPVDKKMSEGNLRQEFSQLVIKIGNVICVFVKEGVRIERLQTSEWSTLLTDHSEV